MGRDSGFIASFATLADTQVGICLIPEITFTIDGVVQAAKQRIKRDGYVVIVVAEGAGQDLLDKAAEWDASGNRRHGDIGAFLRDQISETFRAQGSTASIKYIDPREPELARQRSGRQLLPSIGPCSRSRRHGRQDRRCHRF
jgi:6-phosphofructokinase 1